MPERQSRACCVATRTAPAHACTQKMLWRTGALALAPNRPPHPRNKLRLACVSAGGAGLVGSRSGRPGDGVAGAARRPGAGGAGVCGAEHLLPAPPPGGARAEHHAERAAGDSCVSTCTLGRCSPPRPQVITASITVEHQGGVEEEPYSLIVGMTHHKTGALGCARGRGRGQAARARCLPKQQH